MKNNVTELTSILDRSGSMDAVETAARYDISKDRAVNYSADYRKRGKER